MKLKLTRNSGHYNEEEIFPDHLAQFHVETLRLILGNAQGHSNSLIYRRKVSDNVNALKHNEIVLQLAMRQCVKIG